MGRKRLYPWETWLSRKRFTIRQGRDYVCSQATMSQSIRNAACQAGLKAHVVELVKGLTVLLEREKAHRRGRPPLRRVKRAENS